MGMPICYDCLAICSVRGQTYGTAGSEKIRNLGQQHIRACTSEGMETEVLFQVAEISKPLISVSAICERGNRVIFGKGGGVVQHLAIGHETPFYRQNGIYILEMWLLDEATPFQRQP